MKNKFLKPNNPILSQVATPIEPNKIKSAQTTKIINKMLDIAYGEQKERKKPLLVGLAAPQIGISKRVILVDAAADGKGKVGNLRVYINPKIIWKSKKTAEWYEGCYSTSCLIDRKDGGVCGIVSRPLSIKIYAYNQKGEIVKETHSGYTARIFQHEIDHLDGKEFVSWINNDKKLHLVKDEEFFEYRNKEKWRNWPRKCSRKTWEKIKGIKKK